MPHALQVMRGDRWRVWLMATRGRGSGHMPSAMEKAGEGLLMTGRAATAAYEACRLLAPEVLDRADRALELAERGVVALERLAGEEPNGDE